MQCQWHCYAAAAALLAAASHPVTPSESGTAAACDGSRPGGKAVPWTPAAAEGRRLWVPHPLSRTRHAGWRAITRCTHHNTHNMVMPAPNRLGVAAAASQ